jgi:eukaryotic-like serine/threonine-protein kinase
VSVPSSGGIFQIGDVLNNTYRIEKVLGRGGTSEVYRARSEISGRVMALKALRSEFSKNEDFLALMTREEDMREIRHDAVVRYYDNQRTDNGHIYLVMDYVDGPGLDQKIKNGGMSAEDLMIIARRVAEGLVVAHERNIVHRDLSPDNIILRNGNPAEAVIIDFGIAKDSNPGAETIVGNEFAGKYAYAAPEQLSGLTDERADIYSLGALLLATFRGKAPDVGNNPMEVIERKAQPLDTDGVPEPLKALLETMTVPDRTKRLSSASKLINALHEPTSLTEVDEEDQDRTIIVPLQSSIKARSKPVTAPKPAAAATTKKSRGGQITFVGIFAVLAASTGLYFSGALDRLIGPTYPLVDPYILLAERSENGTIVAIGNVPSPELQFSLSEMITTQGGVADLTLASGDIPDGWGAGVMKLINQIDEMPEWKVAVTGGQVAISGHSKNRTQATNIRRAVAATQLPDGLTATTKIVSGPRIITTKMLEPLLMNFSDCGELTLEDAPLTGYPTGSQIVVDGRVADVKTRVQLSDTMLETIGNRDLILNVDVLNSTLCLVDSALPDAPQGNFEVVFGFGDQDGINTSGRYFVGENPVIDVIIPENVSDGFMFVSALDVSGNVFHLLPNLINKENDITKLRNGSAGPVTVRVAYPLKDAKNGKKLAFTVDDTALGKSKIIVIKSNDEIFDGLRPTTESATGYAEALRRRIGSVQTLDSRILTTAKQ